MGFRVTVQGPRAIVARIVMKLKLSLLYGRPEGFCEFAFLFVLLASVPFTQTLYAVPGARVPWTTYEAEDMAGTGTCLGPGTKPNTVEWESSGRKCVRLAASGQYLEFTAKAVANAMVVRYSLPDAPDGGGLDATLSLYQNGKFLRKLPVTSRYTWLYGKYPFSNRPQPTPRNFYDEVRTKDLAIRPGDKLRLQKDPDDAAEYYVIDLVDLEDIAPPLARPAGDNWLCVTDAPYHAVGDGRSDDTAPIQNCINDARRLQKNVWVPAGTYRLTADINNLLEITLQGAGMWHSTFVGDPAVYNTSAARRVRFNADGSNLHLADFAILGKLNYRSDTEGNDGLGENFGTNSSISRIWIEHTKAGMWIVNSSGLLIQDCRIRNTIADGINLCVGMRNTTVTNCTTRGTGDDCFAIWPATYRAHRFSPGGNTLTHCTAQLPFLANGGAIYGGQDNRILDCRFEDVSYGCGVLLSGTFPVGTNSISGQTRVQNCDLVRCGGYDHTYEWRAAFQLCLENHPVAGLELDHLNILDSLSDGLSVISTGKLSQASLRGLNLPNYGVAATGRHGLWIRSDANGVLTVRRLRGGGAQERFACLHAGRGHCIQ